MRLLSSAIVLALSACSGGDADTSEEAPKPASMWVQQAQTDAAMRAATGQHETMRFVSSGGSVQYATTAGGKPVTVTFDVELAAFQIGDVPTLAHPIGFVKLNPLSLKGSDPSWEKAVLDTVFRRFGSPVQLTYESHSVADMQGRLTGVGTHASGKAVGNLQVDDRQLDVTLNVSVDRLTETTLTLRLLPSELDVSTLALDAYLDPLARQLGGPISRKGILSGTVELKRFDGDLLPSFVRTPVTVQSVAEVVRKIDAEHSDIEAARATLANAGVPEDVAATVTQKNMEQMEEIRRQYKRDAAKAQRAVDLDER